MKKLVWITLAAAAVVSPLFVSGDAEACGGEMFRESIQRSPKPLPPALVAKAEKSLDEGKGDAALKSALQAYPTLAKASPGKDNMMNRALRLAAMATIRSGGEQSVMGAKAPVSYIDYDYGREVNVPAKLSAPKNQEERAARLEWAIKTLRSLHEQNPSNVTVEGDLGEALATVPEHEDEALTKLSSLADKDLLGSPQAYSALAKLRFRAGLTKKSVEALQRCNAMSAKPGTCGPQLPTNPA